MKLFVFAVFDAAAEAYLPPMFYSTKGLAIRAFSTAVNEEGHMFLAHAADYTLFHLGMWDPSSGIMEPLATPDSMGGALTFVERVEVMA